MTRGFILLMAFAVGSIAANLYYAQPLIALISGSLTLAPEAAGLVVTLTQIGYGLGVLFIVPLGDLVENRKLILTQLTLIVFALLGLALSTTLFPYFAAALAVGLGASSVQMIVPYVAHFSTEASRGRTVGSLMSGLMLGIMLSRPIASLLADAFSWHSVFYFSAALMALLGVFLYLSLPPRIPEALGLTYRELISSMGRIFIETETLRRRAIYQAFLFGAFCLFWSTVPLLLAGPDFQFTQKGIAIFALAGIAGAVSAPFAGRSADRGWSQRATTFAILASGVSFLLTHLFSPGSAAALILLVLAANLLDAGVSANLVLGQRAIFLLDARNRSRMNGLYIATIFVGGSLGSALGVWAYAHGGWSFTSWVGFSLPAMAFLYFSTENLKRKS